MFQSFIVGEVEHLFEEVDPEDGLHRPVGTAVVHAVHGSKALLVNQGERLVSENLGPTSLQALSLLRRHQELGLPEALLRVSYSEHPPLARPGAAPTTFYYIIPTLPQAGEGFYEQIKVDYAIMQRGKPAILIECKKYGSDLAEDAVSQLVRYFGVTNAHFGILTDGISYRFFSDLDQPNVMDPKPFFEFNMLSCSDKAVGELKRFTKEEFNVDETLEAAAVLKYIEGMKQALVRQLSTPDEEFSRWLTKQVYSKLLTQAARERFSNLVRQAFREFIDDRVNATLKSALARDTIIDEPTPEVVAPGDTAQPVALEVTTTEEEVQGYELVKTIVR